jgi:hypothetical protein
VKGGVYVSSWNGAFGGYIIVYLLEDHSEVPCRNIARQTPDNNFIRLSRLYVKRKDVETFLSE